MRHKLLGAPPGVPAPRANASGPGDARRSGVYPVPVERRLAETERVKRPRAFHPLPDPCASCGSTGDLVTDTLAGVTFCMGCLEHTQRPDAAVGEMYYAIGGEG